MTFYAIRSGSRFAALALALGIVYLVSGVALRLLLQQEASVFALQAAMLTLWTVALTFILGTGYGFVKQAAALS